MGRVELWSVALHPVLGMCLPRGPFPTSKAIPGTFQAWVCSYGKIPTLFLVVGGHFFAVFFCVRVCRVPGDGGPFVLFASPVLLGRTGSARHPASGVPSVTMKRYGEVALSQYRNSGTGTGAGRFWAFGCFPGMGQGWEGEGSFEWRSCLVCVCVIAFVRRQGLQKLMPELKSSVDKGIAFANK